MDLVRAMNQQMMAERQKRAEILQAEVKSKPRFSAPKAKNRPLVLEAEGRREAAIVTPRREREAQAEGHATKSVSDAIVNGGLHAINYFVAQNMLPRSPNWPRRPTKNRLHADGDQ